MHTIAQLECAIVKGNIKRAPAITRKCLLEGIPPHTIIQDGILKGLDTVGRKWKTYEYFIPNVLVSAMATKLCLEALHPALNAGANRPIGKALAGRGLAELESPVEPALAHDSSTNALIRRCRAGAPTRHRRENPA